MDDGTIRTAFAALGTALGSGRRIEIVIVGGAAGVLLGALPPTWTTADVDMVHCHLPQDRDEVLAAAAEVARSSSLPPAWLSEDVGLYAWTLPDGWRRRVVEAGVYGRLHVFTVSRADLIAMKFLAHRERDLEHLALMKVTADELLSVRRHLDSLAAGSEDAGRIEMARQYLAAWETP